MNLCRLCRSETPPDSYKNLFLAENHDLQIVDIVVKLTGLKILEDDPFPKIICNNCDEKLVNFNNFRESVLHVDTIFQREFQCRIDKNVIKIEDSIKHQPEDGEFMINTEVMIKNDAETVDHTDHVGIERFDSEIAKNGQLMATKRYKCDNCDKCFTQRGTLNIHQRSHTGEKPYHCDICDKAFSQRSHLKIHQKVHSGERSYQCNLCDKSFVQKPHLDNHLNVHTGAKLYKCNVCNKSYAGKQYLNKHLHIHSGEKPFKCKICDKRFALHPYLVTHLKVHSGERPFVCHVCQKSFSQKVNLKTHLRVHNGEKPFVCRICNRCFSQNRDLKVHLKIRHDVQISETDINQ